MNEPLSSNPQCRHGQLFKLRPDGSHQPLNMALCPQCEIERLTKENAELREELAPTCCVCGAPTGEFISGPYCNKHWAERR